MEDLVNTMVLVSRNSVLLRLDLGKVKQLTLQYNGVVKRLSGPLKSSIESSLKKWTL